MTLIGGCPLSLRTRTNSGNEKSKTNSLQLNPAELVSLQDLCCVEVLYVFNNGQLNVICKRNVPPGRSVIKHWILLSAEITIPRT